MQDRFKFRFWSIKDKQFIDWRCYMQTAFNRGCAENPYGLLYSLWTNSKDSIPQQCTGLKDKNGKLIYEWDIVKVPFLDPIFKNVISDKNTELAIVEYYNGCFTIKYVDDNTRVYLYQFNNIEIIGNKYENKELLTGAEN